MIAKDKRTAEVYLLVMAEQFDFDPAEWIAESFSYCLTGKGFERILVITDQDKMRSNYYSAAFNEYFGILRTHLINNGRMGVL